MAVEGHVFQVELLFLVLAGEGGLELAFAAGAMIYVVVEELIPEASAGEHSDLGVLFFSVGFSLMMILDVALG